MDKIITLPDWVHIVSLIGCDDNGRRSEWYVPADLKDITSNYINEHSEPHWTPVIERLPKKSGVYTVTDHKGDVVRFVFNTGSDSSRLYWYRCAKAWMPLPEPYKEVTT